MEECQAWFSTSHFQACAQCREGFEAQSRDNSDTPEEARIRARINYYLNIKGEK